MGPPSKKKKKGKKSYFQIHPILVKFGPYRYIFTRNNGSDSNFLGDHVGGLWEAAPLKIEIHPILEKV